jgi:ABC-type multidrug transport system fused ATPase/permease subunit
MQAVSQLLARLWRHVAPHRRRQLSFLLFLMLTTSFAEIVSIGAVIPFLGVLTSPDRIFQINALKPIFIAMDLTAPSQLVLPISIAFGTAALIAGSMRLFLLWASSRISFGIGSDISISIYNRTLYQPYAVHCGRNSSEVIDGIISKAHIVIHGTVLPVLTILSSVVMLLAILGALLVIDPFIAVSAFSGFGIIYALIYFMTRDRLSVNSKRVAYESTQVIKYLQEGLGGIRDVLIDGSQATYCETYQIADRGLRRAQCDNFIISNSPRYVMEALGMLLIAFLAYVLSQQPGGLTKVIPFLGALALGAQRLLPVMQQAYGSWASIQGGQASLEDTLGFLDQQLPDYANQPNPAPILFADNININQLEFHYSKNANSVLKLINLTIKKGSRVGFVGTTGSGKSTLLDIIMGLLEPSEGRLEIDGTPITRTNCRAWQAHIAHVPQSIFLADSSIEENIAFGVPKNEIDIERVRRAAQQAQLSDTIESLPEQYQTPVGERGVRLSGGQRQRIGIARALYKKADVIVFDEATSALDSETEKAVMQAIESLSEELTLLIIAHRLTTLQKCTQIIELVDGQIKNIGSYDEITEKTLYDNK